MGDQWDYAGMRLDLETVRTRGRAASPPTAHCTRKLTAADLALLATEKGSTPPDLLKIRESHHIVARALAQGLRPGEAAALAGYSLSRVSILQGTPAFQELLALYKKEQAEIFTDFQNKLKTIAIDAADIMHERMLDNPDEIDDSTLLQIIKTGADRSGYGPQTKSTNVNVNIDLAARLESARQRAGLAPASLPAPREPGPTIIDGDAA